MTTNSAIIPRSHYKYYRHTKHRTIEGSIVGDERREAKCKSIERLKKIHTKVISEESKILALNVERQKLNVHDVHARKNTRALYSMWKTTREARL